MADLKISDMQAMQRELFEPHRDRWLPIEPQHGRDFILFMIEEIGEAIAVIKKKGDSAIMNDAEVRAHFVEEMSDVLMYYNDTLLRYGITPEELSDAYITKHCRNMGRDYDQEYRRKYE